MTLQDYLITFWVQTALSGVILLFSLYRFSSRTKLTKLIGLLFLVSFACNIFAFLSDLVNLTGSIYDILLIVIVSMIYNHVTGGRYGSVILYVVVGFIVFSLLNLVFFQKESITSYNKLLSSFIILLYCVGYFYRLLVELPAVHLNRHPMFWYNSGLLLYSAGTIFLFAFTDYLIHVLNDDMILYWSLHNFLGIIQQLFFLIGLYYDSKSTEDQILKADI